MKSGRPKDYKNRTMFTTTMEAELLERFKKICIRDRKNMNEILQEQIEKYLKIHEDGNEQYTLDDPIKATPAFFRDYPVWEKYYQNLQNPEEPDHRFKIHELLNLHRKRFGKTSI